MAYILSLSISIKSIYTVYMDLIQLVYINKNESPCVAKRKTLELQVGFEKSIFHLIAQFLRRLFNITPSCIINMTHIEVGQSE